MSEIKSKNFRKFRLKNSFRAGFKKIAHMGILVIVGEYMLLNVINVSLSQQSSFLPYARVPNHIMNFAVSEKPILRVAQACSNIKNNIDINNILQNQNPLNIKGSRPDFRTLDLQDKEGAKIGYVVKF